MQRSLRRYLGVLYREPAMIMTLCGINVGPARPPARPALQSVFDRFCALEEERRSVDHRMVVNGIGFSSSRMMV